MDPRVALIIGLIIAITCTVLACVLIIPKKKRATLNGFFQWIHDVFNFKILFIETILKVVYIFLTLFCIGAGFFLLFSGYFSSWYSVSYAPFGLILMIVGPILLRIGFEFAMLQILIWRNTNDINKKMGGAGSDIKEVGFDDLNSDEAVAAREARKAEKFQKQQQQYQQYQAQQQAQAQAQAQAQYQQQAQAQKAAPQPGVYKASAPSAEATAPNMVFCAYCGTKYDANKGGCPNGCKQ